jgi:hypothetical protein
MVSFLLRVLPLMQYPRVGGDPFVHYQYAIGLLNGTLTVPMPEGNTGKTVEVFYPPLFHMISLASFLAFPRVDPYAIMKILASAMDALQLVPIYLIVKRVSGSSAGGILASYALLATRNDYQMLSWGGYANIAGLLLAASLVYTVMTEKFVLSAIFSAALGLTHHLSTLFMLAVLVPYFAILVWSKKQVPKALIGVAIGGAIAYLAFYQFAWQSIYYYYTNFSPVYDQGLYMTPYVLTLVEPLLIASALVSFAFVYVREGRGFIMREKLLAIWAAIPFLLAYAYLFGVHWHGVRWIAFIPGPLSVWAGVGLGILGQKRIVIVAFIFLFTVQLFFTMMGYHLDIAHNLIQ